MTTEIDRSERERKRRKEVFEKLKETFFLPSPSGTVMEVVRMCSSEDSSLKDIAELLQTDPALSAEILKYANSAFLSTGIQVASVHKATVKLGMKSVVTLALGLSLLSGHRSGECEGFDYPLFWRTSLAEAVAARALARKNPALDPEELFVCGLLSHMGSLSLATLFPEEYSKLLEEKQHDSISLIGGEREHFGIDSCELTAELFLEWGMPAEFALAAGFHQDVEHVELGKGRTLQVAAILNIAHTVAVMCQDSDPRFDLLDEVLRLSSLFSVDIGEFPELFSGIAEEWHEHGKVFEIATKECYPYSPDPA